MNTESRDRGHPQPGLGLIDRGSEGEAGGEQQAAATKGRDDGPTASDNAGFRIVQINATVRHSIVGEKSSVGREEDGGAWRVWEGGRRTKRMKSVWERGDGGQVNIARGQIETG